MPEAKALSCSMFTEVRHLPHVGKGITQHRNVVTGPPVTRSRQAKPSGTQSEGQCPQLLTPGALA
jgi:hypothetical protein